MRPAAGAHPTRIERSAGRREAGASAPAPQRNAYFGCRLVEGADGHSKARLRYHYESEDMIKVENLRKTFGPKVAVNNISFNVERGEVLGFLGPNGAGKSTTMRMITTLLEPTSGEAHIAGHSIRRDPRGVRRAIGYMPDFFGVYDDMTVWEYLDFFAACYQIPEATRRGLINDLLELVDLAHRLAA